MFRLVPSGLFAALRFFLVALFAVAVLLGTSLLCAIALSLIQGGDTITPGNLSVGLACGLIVWLFVAAFHLRKETITLPAPERDRFMQRVRHVLSQLGYEVTARGPLQLSTQPRFHALLFGGGVQVALKGPKAQVTGPKVCVELLRNRLRVDSHLDIVHQALREPQRFTETLIKRVELRLRVKPEDLAAIRTNVIEVLQTSASVVCEVHLLAQSETGIPENLLEFQIGEWLEQQGIDAKLHKHFIELHRPVSSGEIVLDEIS
jgi:hypothetical protein